jgi:hypothetical protein
MGFHRTGLIVQYEKESPTWPRIDCMSADVMGKPEKPLARQPPNDAHAELQSPPLLPRRQYAPFRAPPDKNIAAMFDTDATFHLLMSALKAVALSNALAMFDTEATFHLLMSARKNGLLANTEAMLVTAAVFHSTMLPYVVAAVVALVTHDVTAAAMLPFVMHVVHCAPTVHVGHVGYAACNVTPHAV